MLFNSIEYLVFLPLVFLVYWKVLSRREVRNIFLIAASYVFYGWWNPIFLLLIFITTLCGYVSGVLLDSESSSRRRKLILWSNVAVNLGILGVFKYFNFFASSFSDMASVVGWHVDAVTLDIILPVGVSFYTFQALSYTIDVYRGSMRGTRDIAAFFVFISFFPQLVAGPIERATNLLPQFLKESRFSYQEALSGMRLILWGLFKKMVVADNAGPIVDTIFADHTSAGTVNLWIGAVLFTFQIYCDFSGYSDIAIGTARLFGINLSTNFRKPYFARGIYDFWQRWHISLTSWLRDYLYFPLGGSRNGKGKTVRNILVVFLTSGLWHGANYTYICWGAYHGTLMACNSIFRNKKKEEKKSPSYFATVLTLVFTFLIVLIGWVIFRSDNMHQSIDYLSLMFSHYSPYTTVMGKTALVWCALLTVLEAVSHKYENPFAMHPVGLWRYGWVRMSVYALFFFFILIFAGNSAQFIYFQF